MTTIAPLPTIALEADLYVDPAVAAREQQAIFERSWQLAGHVADVAEAGSYLTARVGHGVRARRSAARTASCARSATSAATAPPACARGAAPAARRSAAPTTAGRTARTAGSSACRRGAASPASTRRDLPLLPARVEVFSGLVFVNLDADAAPLRESLDGLAERGSRPTASSGSSASRSRRRRQPANWKIVADNYLEGYHVPIAHPGLMRLLDYQRYTVEVGDGYVFFEAPLRDKPSGNRLERAYQRLVRPMPGLTAADTPRLALHLPVAEHDDRPLSRPGHDLADQPGRDRRHARRLRVLPRRAPERRRCAAVQRLNQRLNIAVADEDAELVARVQAGMGTAAAGVPGPLGEREAGRRLVRGPASGERSEAAA